MGNRIAFVFITLPVNVSDPLARLRAIRAETAAFKGTGRAGGRRGLLQGSGCCRCPAGAPCRLRCVAAMYNLVISNVPGPRMPVYLLGAECVEVLPAIPLSDGPRALGRRVLPARPPLLRRYADPEALPQADELPGAIGAAADALIRASAAGGPLRAGRLTTSPRGASGRSSRRGRASRRTARSGAPASRASWRPGCGRGSRSGCGSRAFEEARAAGVGVERGAQVVGHRRRARRVVGRVPAAVGLGALDLGAARAAASRPLAISASAFARLIFDQRLRGARAA